MDYAEAIRFLYGLEHGSVKLGLERIARAVEMREHPERRYATLHVAGTNGKGSTCVFLASILEAAGFRTGLLTSPHLLDYCERIRIGGAMIPRQTVAALATELEPLIRELHLSYFEATTLLAFEAFAQAGVTAAVIEVGMGGRLDATNLVRPEIAVITGIGLDHTKSLGSSLEAIAAEKAGIMKPRTPVLLGDCEGGVRSVFEGRGRELRAPVCALADRVLLDEAIPAPGGTRYRWRRRVGGRQRDAGASGERVIALCGEHQVRNALLAEEAARILAERGFPISDRAISRGLAAARWPGRFQTMTDETGATSVVFDVAHNPQGCAALVDTYRRWLGEQAEPALIVGMLGDKDHAQFLSCLRAISSELYLIPLESPRAGPLARLAQAGREAGFTPQACAGFAEAWDAAARRPARPVLVTGSFLTVEIGMRHLGLAAVASLFPRAAEPARGER
jgi:dihydrofolate synthase/folylpolyglutamate synthase